MVITYYGASCFKVQSGDTILVFDPPSKKSGFKSPRFQADVVFASHGHDNHNGAENISAKEGKEKPFVAAGPGEYEIAGIYARGIKSFHDKENGQKDGLNTIFSVLFENLNICHLGDFNEKELRPEVAEILGDVDILFIPVGGDEVLDAENASKIINQIEPKIIIPMHYITKDFKPDEKKLKEFLKEIGQDDTKPVEKFSFKKKDIEANKSDVVVLSPIL
ncbi:MAG: MBL fold metallo-hydrolase [Candidatus Pacebacteria bacterium]|nr:MBL fold metallo-hydrolase [Candidatus Paceibacterota bacterium]